MTCQISDADGLVLAVEAHMVDKCRILSKLRSQADDGEVTGDYVAGPATKCRWSTGNAIEQAAGGMLEAVTSHTVYLPTGTAVTRFDRIRLTRLGDVDVDPPFEGAINGIPMPAVGCLKVNLKEVVATNG